MREQRQDFKLVVKFQQHVKSFVQRPVSVSGCTGDSHRRASGIGCARRQFEFQVLGVTRAQQAGDLSNQFEIVDAQGEFIIITMSVANIGDRAQSFFGTNQKLVDASGRQYEANSTADMWANKGTGDINPGNSIQVQLAFDVPPGTQPAELEVHDSMFSGGTKVQL